MGDARQLSRTALRRDKILELPAWPQMADPPPELMKIPGFREYHAQEKLYNERLQNVFNVLVNNLGIATSTPGQ